jgi:hypothetical protein
LVALAAEAPVLPRKFPRTVFAQAWIGTECFYFRALSRVRRFALRIRDLRNAKGWSQERLAEEAGIHRTYLGD